MAISFDRISNTTLTPVADVEFDSSGAVQGNPAQPYKALIIGQRLSSGTKLAGELILVSNADQAKVFFGAGSQLAHMCEKYFENTSKLVYVIALDDDGSAVKAAGKITIASGAATADGVLNLYFGGRRVRVAISKNDDQDTITSAIVSAIQADSDLPVSAVVDGSNANECNLTAKNGGLLGNEIDVRINYYSDDETPEGVNPTVTAMASGAANPDVSSAVALMGDEQYNVVIFPYTDDANVAALDDELEEKWGPERPFDGHAISAKSGTVSELVTFGGTKNSKHFTFEGCVKELCPPWEKAAAKGGLVVVKGAIDPARPMQTNELVGILAPKTTDRLTRAERQALLEAGIATTIIDAGGNVLVERTVTSYKTNGFGVADSSYRDIQTKLTLSYIRWSWRARLLRKFPDWKVAGDGTRFGQGQKILTPKALRAEAISFFTELELAGLVEGFTQFKDSLVVERNASDPNRLDVMMLPDLVNQLRVTATKIKFLL